MSDAMNLRAASSLRKAKLKSLIDKGGKLAEEADSRTVIQNLISVTRLIEESNVVAASGKLSDRIGQTSEVVLDAQVTNLNFPFRQSVYLFVDIQMFVYYCNIGTENELRFDGQRYAKTR